MVSKKAKKTILFIEQNRDGTVGGSHICLLQTVRALNKDLYNAIVMFYEENSLVKTFRNEQCDVLIFNKPTGRKFTIPMGVHSRLVHFFQKIYNVTFCVIVPFFRAVLFLVKYRVDLVHLNNCPVAGGDWLLAARLTGKKCISHDRGYAHFNRINLALAKRFDKIICMADWIRAYLRKCGIQGRKLKVLYDGIPFEVLQQRIKKSPAEKREEFGVPGSAPFIGLVGNIQEWKGQLYAVRAIALLRERFPDICCLLIGGVSPTGPDQEYRNTLVDEIKNNNLEKNVIMTGFRKDVPELMNAVDIVLHTSTNPEPFGMVILEAMSLKKCVIATNIGGPKEIIEDTVSGILVSPREPELLAKKIEMLLENSKMRKTIGENAFSRVKNVFNMEQFTEKLHRIYGDLFEDGRKDNGVFPISTMPQKGMNASHYGRGHGVITPGEVEKKAKNREPA